MKAAIFDLDGTILDSMPMWLHAGETYVQKMNRTPEKELGTKLLTMNMTEGALYLNQQYNLNLSVPEIMAGINQVVSDFYRFEADFKPGAEEFLLKLKSEGIKIALCTNTDRESFTPALQRLGIYGLFDGIFTATECGCSKSHPEIFFEVCRKINSVPGETWVFEDALYSIKTAAKAGFKTCGIYDESSLMDAEKIKKVCTVYFNSYKEISEYFTE